MKSISDNVVKKVEQLESLISDLLQDDITHGLARSLRSLKKECQAFKSHASTKSIETDYKGKSLQIGGGTHVLEDFVNIDIYPPADILCDIREGIPLEDNSIKRIFSEHFMEHIDYPISVKKFVSECFRVLEQNGEVIIGVPDSELVIKGYVNNDMGFFNEMMEKWYKNRNCKDDFNTYIDLVNYHFRDQDDDEKYNPHFWGYDFAKLKNLLETAGFSDVKRWEFDSTLANPKREFGSIYVTAIKN